MEIVLLNIHATVEFLEEHMRQCPTIFMSDALYAELKTYFMERRINLFPDIDGLFGSPIEIVDGLGKREYAIGFTFEAKKREEYEQLDLDPGFRGVAGGQ